MPTLYKEIDGWFDEGFSKVYDLFVEEAKDGDSIVEIGCWKGCSAAYLLEKRKELDKKIDCYFFDTWTGNVFGEHNEYGKMLPEFLENLEKIGFKSSFKATVLDSIEASKTFSDENLFAVMLDGNHNIDYVAREIDVWLPKIKKGGLLAFHDYLDQNLRKMFNDKLKNIEDYNSCGLWRK